MQACFRFTRQGCHPLWDTTVLLSAISSDSFSIEFSNTLEINLELQQAAGIGILHAYTEIAPLKPLSVKIVEITDHSGTSPEIAVKTCASGAMYHLLGVPDLAPFPGYPPDGA